MQANANPMTISYTWMKDGAPINNNGIAGIERIVSDGAVLNITKLTRNDAGIYQCKAVNSQGSATMNITVIVECKCSMIVFSRSQSLFLFCFFFCSCQFIEFPLCVQFPLLTDLVSRFNSFFFLPCAIFN